MLSGCSVTGYKRVYDPGNLFASSIEFDESRVMRADGTILDFSYENLSEESRCFNYHDMSAVGIPYAIAVSSDGVFLDAKPTSILADVNPRQTVSWALVGPMKNVHFPVNITNVYDLAPGKYQVEFAIYEADCEAFYEEPTGFPSSRYLKEKIFLNTLELPYSKIEEQILSDFDLDPLDGRIIVFRGQYEIKPAS